MKKKTLWKVLVVILTLVLTVGIFAACGKKPSDDSGKTDDGNKPDDNNPVTTSTSKEKQNTFFNTMFGSANEIGGTAVDLSEGNNLSLNVGISLALNVYQNKQANRLPISITAKGLLDRTNVRVTSFAEDTAEKKTGKWVWTGDYIAYDEAKHAGWERFKLDGTAYVADGNGGFVKNIVAYDSTKAAHNAAAAVRYFGATFALNANNDTVLDICITTAGVQSLRVYYEVDDSNGDGDARGLIYLTLAGNKYKIDLNQAADADNGKTKKIEDVLYNFIETKVLQNSALKSVIGSFGEDFDLNKLLSGLILPLIQKKIPEINENNTLADYLLGNKTPLLGKTTVADLVKNLFGSEENVKKFLGNTLDVNSIINQVNTMLFNDPKWYTWDGSKFSDKTDYYDALVKNNLSQKLQAEIQFGGSIGNTLVKPMTFLNDNNKKSTYLSLGFVKDAGTATTIGKMDKFYIDLHLDGINGTDFFDISASVDDLSFGKTTDDISFTAMSAADKAAYGAFIFEAGAELSFSEEIMSLVFHRSSDITTTEGYEPNTDNSYEIVLGKDNGGVTLVDADGKTVYVPSKLKIEIKGALDFASPKGTKILANVIAEGYNNGADLVIATVQLKPAEDNKTLTADVKVFDTKLLPYIMNLVAYQCNVINNNGTVGKNGFTQYNGHWGWWHEGYELIALDDGFNPVTKSAAITSGVYYTKGADVYNLIADVNTIADGTVIYQLKDNMSVLTGYNNYVAVKEGTYYGDNVKYYKKNADATYSAAEAGYTGQLYVCEAQYEAASGKSSLTKLYNSKGKVSYYASAALDNFFKTGEIRVTGINLYNLLFNGSAQIIVDEYWYLGVNGYEQNAVASDVQSNGAFDWIKAFLLNPNKNSGLLSVIDKLYGYSASKGELTLGAADVMDVLFGDGGVFAHSNKDKIPVSVYSVLGYLVDNGKTDIIDAWKRIETSIGELTQRGIWFNDFTPVLRLDRADGLVSEGEALLAEWTNASTTATRKTAIEKELLALGYRLVRVNGNANDAVLYPAILADNEVAEWSKAWAGATGTTADSYSALLAKNGFVIESATAAEYSANKNTFGYFTRTVTVGTTSTAYYAKVTSKSVAALKADWITAENAGNADTATDLKLALLRRGQAARKYQDAEDNWQYYIEKVVIDEAMLANADATVKIYTEKNAAKDVITKAGIRVDINYCGAKCALDMYMNFAPTGITVAQDGTVTVAGFSDNLLGEDGYKVMTIRAI